MPCHLEKLKSIWQECQRDLSDREDAKKQPVKMETLHISEPASQYKLGFEDQSLIN